MGWSSLVSRFTCQMDNIEMQGSCGCLIEPGESHAGVLGSFGSYPPVGG